MTSLDRIKRVEKVLLFIKNNPKAADPFNNYALKKNGPIDVLASNATYYAFENIYEHIILNYDVKIAAYMMDTMRLKEKLRNSFIDTDAGITIDDSDAGITMDEFGDGCLAYVLSGKGQVTSNTVKQVYAFLRGISVIVATKFDASEGYYDAAFFAYLAFRDQADGHLKSAFNSKEHTQITNALKTAKNDVDTNFGILNTTRPVTPPLPPPSKTGTTPPPPPPSSTTTTTSSSRDAALIKQLQDQLIIEQNASAVSRTKASDSDAVAADLGKTITFVYAGLDELYKRGRMSKETRIKFTVTPAQIPKDAKGYWKNENINSSAAPWTKNNVTEGFMFSYPNVFSCKWIV
jgi:hypothetical protein